MPRFIAVLLVFVTVACVPTLDGERPRTLIVDDSSIELDAGTIDGGVDRDGGPEPPRDGGPRPYTGPTYVDDIAAIVGADCRGCHGTPLRFGAPMPLEVYADFLRAPPSDATGLVYEVIGERVLPDAPAGVMPPRGPIAASRIQTIRTWVAARAPEGPRTPP